MTDRKIAFDPDTLDWDKVGGLIPVVVQNRRSGTVLMQGFMNREALAATLATGKITFWSRTKGRLWTKGEESRHYLYLAALTADCDRDCLLAAADPVGPTCHRGTESCFDGHPAPAAAGLALYDPAGEPADPEAALAAFRADPAPASAALLLKAALDLLAANGVALSDADAVFLEKYVSPVAARRPPE